MSYLVIKKPENKFIVRKGEDHPSAIAGGFLTREDAIAFGEATGRELAD